MRRRFEGPAPDGGRAKGEWDDETGDFDMTEYDSEGAFLRRRQRRYVDDTPRPGEIHAEDVFLDEAGQELGRVEVPHEPPSEDELRKGGWVTE